MLFFCSANSYAGQSVNARYVRVQLFGENRILSLAEVEVFSGGVNRALNGVATQGSTFKDAVAAKAIDGNKSGEYFVQSTTHTNSENYAWWQLDLGAMYDITKILIFNRTDCCMDRINPASIQLLDDEKELVLGGPNKQ